MAVLSTHGLTVGYPGKEIIRDINLSLSAGVLSVLVGANGSGKSTLLRTLAGTQAPLAGTVEIDGCEIASLNRREHARSLAVVLTGRSGGGALTVRECVEIGRHPHTGAFGHLGMEDREAIESAIEAVGIADKTDRYLGTLSDGERQKVMIARALAQHAGIIILDEPTAFLDVAGRLDSLQLLRKLADNGHNIVLSTHDIAPAIACADTIMVVDKEKRTLLIGEAREMKESGALDRAFAGKDIHFDITKGDYIANK